MRKAPWIERMGLAHVKQRIVEDAEGRKTLHRRFLHAQSFCLVACLFLATRQFSLFLSGLSSVIDGVITLDEDAFLLDFDLNGAGFA